MNNLDKYWKKDPVLVKNLYDIETSNFLLMKEQLYCALINMIVIVCSLIPLMAKSQWSAEIDEYYAEVRYERIAILNALGAYYSYLGKIETKQREKEDYFIQATKYYNKASRIDMHEPSTWIGKGKTFMLLHWCYLELFWLQKCNLNVALAVFSICLGLFSLM